MRFIAGHHLNAVHQSLRKPDHVRQCECGCDEYVNPRNPVARYIEGHQLAASRAAYKTVAEERALARIDVSGRGLCECGCGKEAPIAKLTSEKLGTVMGHPRRFISGHNSVGMKRGEGRYMNDHGYILLRKPDHPRAMKGYVLEHRYVMEQHIGRYLATDEHVHHLNHDRADNALDNLIIVDPIEHAKYHTSQIRRPQSEEHKRNNGDAIREYWASIKGADRAARIAKSTDGMRRKRAATKANP